MQVLFLSQFWTVALCFLVWPTLQVISSLACMKIPDRYLSPDAPLFRERRWEKHGQIYNRLFKVQKWKKLLPDGGAVVKGGYRKKRISSFTKENLEKFLVESCRAEVSHLLAILPFWVFGFFAPPYVIGYMLVYALAVNLPCIIAQRYNRPRIQKLLSKL